MSSDKTESLPKVDAIGGKVWCEAMGGGMYRVYQSDGAGFWIEANAETRPDALVNWGRLVAKLNGDELRAEVERLKKELTMSGLKWKEMHDAWHKGTELLAEADGQQANCKLMREASEYWRARAEKAEEQMNWNLDSRLDFEALNQLGLNRSVS